MTYLLVIAALLAVYLLSSSVSNAQAAVIPMSKFRFAWSAVIPLSTLESMIKDAASEAGIAAAQVMAIVYIESRGNPNAVNPSDPSYGLMALQIPTARGFADQGDVVTNVTLLDPVLNLKCGARFLGHLSERYAGSMDFGEWAQAYNVGETKFNRGIRNPGYAARVFNSETGEQVMLGPGELAAAFAGNF